MIHVKIRKSGDLVIGFTATGHAEYAERGKDIVCAAASAIMQTAIIGINVYLGLDAEVTKFDGKLTFRLRYRNQESIDTRAILSTMELGLRDLQKQYPAHIKLEEVKS